MRLSANTREITGKATRKLRHQGVLPAVVYGHHASTATIQLDTHEFERVFHRTGRTQLIDLVVDGGRAHKVLVKEVQRSPRRNSLVHVDFQQVSMREKLQVEVPVVVTGEAELVKVGDADVLQIAHTLRVESLPADIPEMIQVDISGLDHIDAGIRISELGLPSGVALVGDPEELVVKLAARRVALEEEVEEVAEEEAAAEGEEAPAEGAPEEPAASAETPAER